MFNSGVIGNKFKDRVDYNNVNATYYVSSKKGNDSNDGLSKQSPWQTLAKVAGTSLNGGDTVAFRGGDTFYESLGFSAITGSGTQITFTSYGTGKAIFDGSKPITGWSDTGGNIWSADTSGNVITQVFKGSTKLLSPQLDGTATSVETIRSVFTDTNLGAGLDLVDSYIFVQGAPWQWQMRIISAYNPTTKQITLDADLDYDINVGESYFITSSLELLSSQGDWACNSANDELYMYSTSEPSGVRVTYGSEIGFDIYNCNYFTIDNLKIINFGHSGIHHDGYGCSDIVIQNNTFENNYKHGVYAKDAANSTVVHNNVINNCNQKGVISYAGKAVITNNKISNIGIKENLTTSWDSYYVTNNGVGIGTTTADVVIKYNDVQHTGYNGIDFRSPNSVVEYNYVNDFCGLAVDGSGIYTYGTSNNDSVIRYNTIINPVMKDNDVYGIYADDASELITISYNNISNCKYGYFSHNTINCTLEYNKIEGGSVLHKDDTIGPPSTGNTFNYNEVFSNDVAPYYISNTRTTNYDFVTSDYNEYFSASDTSVKIVTTNHNKEYPLSGWTALSGEDVNSQEDSFTTRRTSMMIYNETGVSVTKPITNGVWYDKNGVAQSGEIIIPAYGSEILSKPYENLHPELITNGAFDADTDWLKYQNTTISGGTANIESTGTYTNLLRQDTVSGMNVGDYYEISFDISNYVTGGIRVSIGGTSYDYSDLHYSNGNYLVVLQREVGASDNLIFSNGDVVTELAIDNVSVKLLPSEPNTGISYHVANDGDDANDGLTEATAWQTLGKVLSS